MKILLATDGSKSSQGALRTVIAHYRPQGAEVRVVHVAVPIESNFPLQEAVGLTPELGAFHERQLEHVRKLVEEGAAKLRHAGFKANAAVLEGDAKTTIVDAAAKWRADLIVVGSHGRKGLDRFLIGSVSEFVARHAPCSVEIVRNTARR